MEKGTEKEMNLMVMANQYLKENIQMVKEMEKAKNIIVMAD